MKIKLKTLSPVHIGSGEEISPTEYFIEGSKFIRLDMDGLFKDPDFNPVMDKFIEWARNQRYIGDIFPNKSLLLRHPLYYLPVSSRAKNPIAVKAFVKSAGRVYLPGSSVKGSILSGVMEEVLKESRKTNLRDYSSLINQVIGELSTRPQHNRFSRWLDVSDSDLRKPEDVLEISLAKLSGARSPRQMEILYETLKEGVEFNLEIKTSINSVDKWGRYTEKQILEMADKFYRKVYEKEKSSSQFPLPTKEFLLRLGQGSSAYSTSFLVLAEELGAKDYRIFRPPIRGRKLSPMTIDDGPRTRKLISGKKSLGWVEVKIE